MELKLKDVLKLMENSDYTLITRGSKTLYSGFRFHLNNMKQFGLTGNEVVERLRMVPEYNHRQWKAKGLENPINEEMLPTIELKDMQITLWYKIILK